MALRLLYPPIDCFKQHSVQVSSLHRIYVEESGNPSGVPVFFLHGGPGAGCMEFQRQLFDPTYYRIILMDQRGCGRSTPYACTEQNTTWDLVEDIETIRRHLQLETIWIAGGSWGSTLGLCYAHCYPSSVRGLILRAIFLGTQREFSWMFEEGGASRIFPEEWKNLLRSIPQIERDRVVDSCYRALTCSDPIVRQQVAISIARWDAVCSQLSPNPDSIDFWTSPHQALALATLEMHYSHHHFFFPSDDYLLKKIDYISHLPCILMHGRYDVACTIDAAFTLHEAWPKSELIVLPMSPHTLKDPYAIDAMIQATDRAKYL